MRATIRRSAELVLVAHGTRNTAGLRTIGEIAAAVSRHVGPVRTAFVDVLGPNPRELLAESRRPTVVVPAFLASGYHVNTDLPARVIESGHPAAIVTQARIPAANPAGGSGTSRKEASAVTRLMVGPADRSMPPSRMTVSWPSATSRSGATWMARLARLRGVRK